MPDTENPHPSNPLPITPHPDAAWEAEVRAMSQRLAAQSHRSGLIGFIGGMAVMGGLVILAWGVMSQIGKNKSLTTEVQTKTTLVNEAQQQAATASAQAATASTVLNKTVENLQAQNPSVSSSAAAALDAAFDADPNAAKLLVRVYVHIGSETQRPTARHVASALRGSGYIVPGVDVKPEKPKQTEIHYYSDDPQSLSDAAAIAKIVTAAGVPCGKRQVPQSAADKLRPRAYGLWLAASVP
jgi:hypothetical protein